MGCFQSGVKRYFQIANLFCIAHFYIRHMTGYKIVIFGSAKHKYLFISILMLTSRFSIRIYLVSYQNTPFAQI